jgi:hypothetical protein
MARVHLDSTARAARDATGCGDGSRVSIRDPSRRPPIPDYRIYGAPLSPPPRPSCPVPRAPPPPSFQAGGLVGERRPAPRPRITRAPFFGSHPKASPVLRDKRERARDRCTRVHSRVRRKERKPPPSEPPASPWLRFLRSQWDGRARAVVVVVVVVVVVEHRLCASLRTS